MRRLSVVSTARFHVERATDALLRLEDGPGKDLLVQGVAWLRALEAEEERLCRAAGHPVEAEGR